MVVLLSLSAFIVGCSGKKVADVVKEKVDSGVDMLKDKIAN